MSNTNECGCSLCELPSDHDMIEYEPAYSVGEADFHPVCGLLIYSKRVTIQRKTVNGTDVYAAAIVRSDGFVDCEIQPEGAYCVLESYVAYCIGGYAGSN